MDSTPDRVRAGVRAVLTELAPTGSGGLLDMPTTPEVPLRDLGIDSLLLVQLITRLEDTFDIRIEGEDLHQQSFATVQTVSSLISRYLADAATTIGRPTAGTAAAAGNPSGAFETTTDDQAPAGWSAVGPEGRLLLSTARPDMTRDQVKHALSLLAATNPRLDWGAFMDLAIRHRVLGIVARSFDRERLGPIGTVRRSVVRAAYLYNAGRARSWERERGQVFAAFAADGIRPVVRKGSYLSTYAYPDVAMRYMEDTDLYVAADEVDQTAKTLERLGYRQGTDSIDRRTVGPLDRDTELFWQLNVSALPPFLRPTSDPYVDVFSIDLRRDLMEPASGKSVPAEDFRERARRVPLAGEYAWVPSDEDMLLDIAVHLFREATTLSSIRSGKDLCLIRFVDLAQWYGRVKATLDVALLVTLAERYDVAPEIYYALHFADLLFPGLFEAGLLAALRPADLTYLDEYGRLDGRPSMWPAGFQERLFDRNRVRHVTELSVLPRPRRQW